MLSDWKQFVKDGDRCYEYITTQFDAMFHEDRIVDFSIRYTSWKTMDIAVKIDAQYRQEIQPYLIRWLQLEYDSGCLLLRDNWKLYRDFYTITDAYLGYRRLFIYNGYFFQVIMIWDEEENRTSIEAGICGWKVNDDPFLYPDQRMKVTSDEMIPLEIWKVQNN